VALSPIPIIAVVQAGRRRHARGRDPRRDVLRARPPADKLLTGLKDWMGEHNAVIMSVLCLVIGVKLIGDAISGLTA
jgi:hypothetical protein